MLLIPKALAIPSPELLRQANTALSTEVAHRTAELADELERRSVIEAELRRLALIVEHTSNIAVITDAAHHLVGVVTQTDLLATLGRVPVAD